LAQRTRERVFDASLTHKKSIDVALVIRNSTAFGEVDLSVFWIVPLCTALASDTQFLEYAKIRDFQQYVFACHSFCFAAEEEMTEAVCKPLHLFEGDSR